MCGIVGYTGPQSAFTPIVEGLRRLEYRGYDSAGIALGTGTSLFVEKRAGKLANLEGALPANLPTVHSGIGHTRWATHGGPTDRNAHPHLDNEGKLAVIHNGIIENYAVIKEKTNLTDIALFSMYYDQAHFIKHFKSITKETPNTLLSKISHLGMEDTYWYFED